MKSSSGWESFVKRKNVILVTQPLDFKIYRIRTLVRKLDMLGNFCKLSGFFIEKESRQ